MTDTQQPEVVQQRAIRIAEKAYEAAISVEIDSPEMFTAAGAELQAIKTRAKEIETLRLSITRPMDEAKKRVMDMFRAPLERLDQAEQVVRTAMLSFQHTEQERAARARREAEEAARIERERLEREQHEAEAEAKRIRQEAEASERARQAEADAARRSGDEAAAKAAEEAAALQRAEAERMASEAAFIAENAAQELQLAEVAPVYVPAIQQPKAAGISTRQNWKADVTDLKALVIAAGDAAKHGDTTLLGYLQANEKAIGQVVRALKAQARIPGVRIYAEDALAVRSAA